MFEGICLLGLENVGFHWTGLAMMGCGWGCEGRSVCLAGLAVAGGRGMQGLGRGARRDESRLSLGDEETHHVRGLWHCLRHDLSPQTSEKELLPAP